MRVLVTSLGGSPAIDVVKSLARDPSLHLVGADSGPWGREIARRHCAEVVEIPPASAGDSYVTALIELARSVDFVFVGLDTEVETIAAVGRELPVPTALAPLWTLPIILDKARTFEVASRRPGGQELFPATTTLSSMHDVERAFSEIGGPLWIRPQAGSSGQGSLKVQDADEARAWMTQWRRRLPNADWMAQEFLPGRNYNCSFVFVDSEVVATAAMERLEYLLGKVAPSGVTGQVKRCRTVVDHRVREVAEAVVRAVDPAPHGVYSVDLREDRDGVPRVNEINPRLAGRPWLYTNAGVNLPLAALRALTGRPIGDALTSTGLEAGLVMYRQIDVEPVIGREPD